MNDINTYANELLIDFADAMHGEITRLLHVRFGDDWLAAGVRSHFKSDQFSKVERMLQNPMRVTDMNKSPEDLHGLEHFWNIINGNWKLFQDVFKDKKRTEVYFGEISELRHNLAHRRKRNVLLKSDLIRIVGNCAKCLSALDSQHFERFAEVVDSLASGGTPWGSVLEGRLPPSDEIYTEFVERPRELKILSDWFASDRPQILVWGYGGAGKSALAYRFARDVRDSSSDNLIAVCWVSAKQSEYIEGSVRRRSPDFANTDGIIRAIWSALYTADEVPNELDTSQLISELNNMPILLIIDDFDTVSEDENLSEFLLHDLRNTSARVIYTSRHRVQGMRHLEVGPFTDEELARFVSLRSVEYNADRDKCLNRLVGIRSVTSGYPLFVDDLIHHAAIIGVDNAMQDWSQRRGDAAREYALRRQVEHLGRSCGDVLIALSVSDRSLFLEEISNTAGLTDDDVEGGLRELLSWRMVTQVICDDTPSPAYRMNPNTNRLVQQTYRDDNRFKSYSASFKALTGERVPEAKKRAIGRVIYQTLELYRTRSIEAAERHLEENMTGELKDSADLFGVLGRLRSKQSIEEFRIPAREAFARSHELGSMKVDTYFHWAIMEKNYAETMIDEAQGGTITDEDIAKQWKECERICEMGVKRCGSFQLLCYWAGYAACRDAKAMDRARNYAYAHGAYGRSIDWYKQALTARVADVSPVKMGSIYRGLTLAYDGLGDGEKLRHTLTEWYAVSGSDEYFESACGRLIRKYPQLRDVQKFQYLLALTPSF